jgi:hypothetical protein
VPPDNVQTQSPRVCFQVLRDGGGAAAAQLNAYASLDRVPPLLYRMVLAVKIQVGVLYFDIDAEL